MPIKRSNNGGFTWGRAGTKSKLTRQQAEQVQRAAFANGYKGSK